MSIEKLEPHPFDELEQDCLDCGYRCVGFVSGECCSSTCNKCGCIHPSEEVCPECGYFCSAMENGGPCRSYGGSYGSRGNEFEYECDFADPGGNSALRAETEDNPREFPCPTCDSPNRLTPKDVALGYQCDSCADRAEMGME